MVTEEEIGTKSWYQIFPRVQTKRDFRLGSSGIVSSCQKRSEGLKGENLMVRIKFILMSTLMLIGGFNGQQALADDKSNEIETEVMLYVNDNKNTLDRAVRVFNGLKGHWVPLTIDKREEVVKYYSKGNLAFVITLENLYAFSALTDRWATQPVKIPKIAISGPQVTINIDGNVGAVVFPDSLSSVDNVYAFSAHVGQWAKSE